METNGKTDGRINRTALVRLSYLYFAAWFFAALFLIEVVVIVGAKLADISLEIKSSLFLAPLSGLVVLAPFIVILALRFRCPRCGGFCTVQTTRPLSQNFQPYSGLMGWTATVARIAFQKTFICMYCDYEVQLSDQSGVRRN